MTAATATTESSDIDFDALVDFGRRRFVRAALVMTLTLLAVLGCFVMYEWRSVTAGQQAATDASQLMFDSVAREVAAHTSSVLRPAELAAELISDRIADADTFESGESLDRLLQRAVRSDALIDAAFVGTSKGSFDYFGVDGNGYLARRIRPDNLPSEGVVVETVFDDAMSEQSTRVHAVTDYDPRERSWYRASLDEGVSSWSDPYVFFSSSQVGVTRFSAPIASGDDVLVVGIDVRLSTLSEFMADRLPSPNATVFGSTRAGSVFAEPSYAASGLDELVSAPVEFSEAWTDSLPEGVVFSTDAAGTDRMMRFETVAANEDWLIAVQAPVSDFVPGDASTTRLAIVLLELSILLVLILVVATWSVTRVQRAIIPEFQRVGNRVQQRLTERDRREHRLIRANSRLESSAVMSAHELLAPVRSMRAATDIELGAGGGAYVRQMSELVDRAARIVATIIDRAIESDPATTSSGSTSVHDAVDRTVLLFSCDLAAVDGEVVVNGDLGEVPCDETTLDVVFQNLFSNAIRHCREGMPLRVSVSRVDTVDEAVLSIRDNGVGIPLGAEKQIFEAGFQAGVSGALGVGLATVTALLEPHGAWIEARRNTVHGSSFTIRFPSSISRPAVLASSGEARR